MTVTPSILGVSRWNKNLECRAYKWPCCYDIQIFDFTFCLKDHQGPYLVAVLYFSKISWQLKFDCRIIIYVTNYGKWNFCYYDDIIDDVKVLLWAAASNKWCVPLSVSNIKADQIFMKFSGYIYLSTWLSCIFSGGYIFSLVAKPAIHKIWIFKLKLTMKININQLQQ